MSEQVQVVIIGGGATGTGLARDLAMRGFAVCLIEMSDLANGASGRLQGLLHSGSRYAVDDPQSARECNEENRILRRIARHCIGEKGGLAVSLTDEEEERLPILARSCQEAGIAVSIISGHEARALEPLLSPEIRHGMLIPADASIDPFRLTAANAASAWQHGARLLRYHAVTGFLIEGGRVRGVNVAARNGGRQQIFADFVVNATGAWAGQVARMAALSVPLTPNKGSMLIYSTRLNQHMIQRCRPPQDGDGILAVGNVSIIGTTSVNVDDPGAVDVEPWEVDLIVAQASTIIPAVTAAKPLRAFAGVRPLYNPGPSTDDGRSLSRGFQLIDHQERDGLTGLLTVVGGKLTTYRHMAEKTADLLCAKSGVRAACRTHLEPLPGAVAEDRREQARHLWPSVPLAQASAERLGSMAADVLSRVERDRREGQVICECEQVTRAECAAVIDSLEGELTLADIMRRTRAGMGTCQGSFCAPRLAGLAAEHRELDGPASMRLLLEFLQERWLGCLRVPGGDHLRQAELTQSLYAGLLNLDRMGVTGAV